MLSKLFNKLSSPRAQQTLAAGLAGVGLYMASGNSNFAWTLMGVIFATTFFIDHKELFDDPERYIKQYFGYVEKDLRLAPENHPARKIISQFNFTEFEDIYLTNNDEITSIAQVEKNYFWKKSRFIFNENNMGDFNKNKNYILAHEIAHIKNKDGGFLDRITGCVVQTNFLYTATCAANYFLQNFTGNSEAFNKNAENIIAALFLMSAARIVNGIAFQNIEFKADLDAVNMTQDLKSALGEIESWSERRTPESDAGWGNYIKSLVKMNHPSDERRIEYLQKNFVSRGEFQEKNEFTPT